MLTQTAGTRCHKPSSFRVPGLSTLFGLYRQRRSLADLDPRRLADIGVSTTEAEAEAKRPIWDVPAHWRR
jgi:hypothetical protein